MRAQRVQVGWSVSYRVGGGGGGGNIVQTAYTRPCSQCLYALVNTNMLTGAAPCNEPADALAQLGGGLVHNYMAL